MNKLFTRLAFILIAGLLLIVYALPATKTSNFLPKELQKDYKLGLDLQGGVELDYKVDLEEAKKAPDFSPKKQKNIIEGLKRIIDKRIESLDINDSVITSADYAWEQHIIVQIPLKGKNSEDDKLNIERAKKAIWKVTKIVFKERRTKITQADLDERKKIAKKAFEQKQKSKYPFSVLQAQFKDNYDWIKIGEINSFKDIIENPKDILENKLNEVSLKTQEKWYLIFDKKWDKIDYIFINAKPSDWIPAKDKKWRILNDKYFVKAAVSYNKAFQPQIELNFNSKWAEIFGELSSRLVGKQMAIFVGWEMLTHPVIRTPILDGRAVITWDYTPDEAVKLATDINTWVVPAPIYLTSEKAIDSKLWASSLEKLIFAWATWFLLIFIFLIWAYRLSWFLASIALVLYVVIILAIVKTLGITLTLASIAGLILSIWMAIDANVLIFERIIDELKSWEKIVKATKIGFKKSWSAIWDSNVTGLIVAIILFIFGINMIKWFWLMLGLWILVSLFSVMWISKVLVLLLAEKSKNTKKFIGY